MTTDFELNDIATKLKILINEQVQDRLDDIENTDYKEAVLEVVEIIDNNIKVTKDKIEYFKENNMTIKQFGAESELSICLSIKEEMIKWNSLLKMMFENNDDGGITES